MSRFLLALSILQLIAIGLLFREVGGLHHGPAPAPVDPLSVTTRSANVGIGPTHSTSSPEGEAAGNLSQDVIRAIVREELQAALGEWTQPPNEPAREGLTDAASLAQLEEFYLAVDGYMYSGQISDSDMAALQSKMARLNPTHRKQALRRLTQAINSGGLDARL